MKTFLRTGPALFLLVSALAGCTRVPPKTDSTAAPEISGPDQYGAEFKLSDYRGKAVMLVFTGNWCGPCRMMYPEERSLASKLAARRFVLLAVNTDDSREVMLQGIKEHSLNWRTWWDGDNPPGNGPISVRYAVEGFPTICLIDHKGKLRTRYVGMRSAAVLEKTILPLIEEAERDEGS